MIPGYKRNTMSRHSKQHPVLLQQASSQSKLSRESSAKRTSPVNMKQKRQKMKLMCLETPRNSKFEDYGLSPYWKNEEEEKNQKQQEKENDIDTASVLQEVDEFLFEVQDSSDSFEIYQNINRMGSTEVVQSLDLTSEKIKRRNEMVDRIRSRFLDI
jgi:hypothetical protein